jgi:O-glycosyl hydrolase
MLTTTKNSIANEAARGPLVTQHRPVSLGRPAVCRILAVVGGCFLSAHCSSGDAGQAGSSPGDLAGACRTAAFVSGSVTPQQVAPGGAFTVLCLYDAPAPGSNAVKVAESAGTCQFTAWSKESAEFSCKAGGAVGSWPVACELADIAPYNFCAQTNSVGTLRIGTSTDGGTSSDAGDAGDAGDARASDAEPDGDAAVRDVGAGDVTSGPGPTVTITWTDLHQTIEGFGAAVAFQGGNPWTSAEADLLFCGSSTAPCAQAGAGLSLVRCQIEPDGTYPFVAQMQAAIARGARAWCTPWSAPAAYKTNNSVDNGGYLLTADYQNWANYLSNYVATLNATYHVPLYALSVQNEPDFVASYQSLQYTAQNFHDFILGNIGPTLKAKNPGVRLIFPEESHWQFDLATTTLKDPAAAAYVDIVAAHGYYSAASAYPLAQDQGIELWETEDATLSSPNDASMSDALDWASTIHSYLTVANANAWMSWWGVDSVDCTGQGLINDSNSGAPCTGMVVAKRLWAIGNFSRFVRPGWVRVDATAAPASGVLASAYKNPATGNFAVVVINQNASSALLKFELNGFVAGSVTPWVTSSSSSLVQEPTISVGNASSFLATLQPSSVTTFVGP